MSSKIEPFSFGIETNFPNLRTADHVFSTVYALYFDFIQTLNSSQKNEVTKSVTSS